MELGLRDIYDKAGASSKVLHETSWVHLLFRNVVRESNVNTFCITPPCTKLLSNFIETKLFVDIGWTCCDQNQYFLNPYSFPGRHTWFQPDMFPSTFHCRPFASASRPKWRQSWDSTPCWHKLRSIPWSLVKRETLRWRNTIEARLYIGYTLVIYDMVIYIYTNGYIWLYIKYSLKTRQV